jgi:biopolymer transport protein ExbB/TolQ
VQEVVDVLSVQSDIDSRESDNSYTMIKVFVACIPILGFIGTVYGIGTAVGGFGTTLEGAGDVDAIKNSLGGVTSGLSVAFDTTLLALVMSILLMIPLGSVQQIEENSLNEIDNYVNNKFVNFLQEEEDLNGGPAGAVREAMAEQARETKTFFREQIGELSERLPAAAAGGEGQSPVEMQPALVQIQGLHREQMEMMAQTSTVISEHGAKMQEVFEANTGFLNDWGRQFTEHLRESQGAIVQSEGKVVEQLEGSSKVLASETERVINVYKEMGNEFATELTQFFDRSLSETQRKMAEHIHEEQARMETLMSRQEEATAGFSQAVKEAMDGLAESTTRWQGNEAELLSLFEQKAQENINVMSEAFKVLVEKQTDLVQSTHAMKEEARRQTEVCQQLIPALASAAEKQLIETRQKLERDSEAHQREMMDRHSALLREMQEQSQQQSEILKEFHQSQKAEQQSLDRLTDRWGAIASTLDGLLAADGTGKKKKWWQFG